jgi:hypothetical protein
MIDIALLAIMVGCLFIELLCLAAITVFGGIAIYYAVKEIHAH